MPDGVMVPRKLTMDIDRVEHSAADKQARNLKGGEAVNLGPSRSSPTTTWSGERLQSRRANNDQTTKRFSNKT